MKLVLKIVLAIVVLIVGYRLILVATVDTAAGVVMSKFGFPDPGAGDVKYAVRGFTQSEIHYPPVTSDKGEVARNLVASFDFASPFDLAFSFDLESDTVTVSGIRFVGTVTPLKDRKFELAAGSVHTVSMPDGAAITGIRTRKDLNPSEARYDYTYQVDRLEVPEMTPEIRNAFGTVVEDITLLVRRQVQTPDVDGRFGPETLALDFQLGSWGPMQVRGAGKLDFNGDFLNRGQITVSASGVEEYTIRKAFEAGVGGVVVATLGIVCFTRQTGDGYTADILLDRYALSLSTQPPCDAFKPLTLQKFTSPVSHTGFFEGLGAVLY